MGDREYIPSSSPGGGAAREAEGRSTTELVSDTVEHVQEIVRSEVRLAAAEMREKATEAAKGGAMFAAGAAVSLYGAGFLLVAGYKALSRATRPWFSALTVGLALEGAAAALIAMGREKLARMDLKPERTISTLKESTEALSPQRS